MENSQIFCKMTQKFPNVKAMDIELKFRNKTLIWWKIFCSPFIAIIFI